MRQDFDDLDAEMNSRAREYWDIREKSIADAKALIEIAKNERRRPLTVHASGRSDGAGNRVSSRVVAAVTNSKTLRDCWRQVSITVSSVSTKRLSLELCVPKLSLRQMTAGRSASVTRFCSLTVSPALHG